MHTHLPADICNASSALPALITYASQGNPQATAAVSALQHLHKVLQNRPASCSLFLDSIIQSGGNLFEKKNVSFTFISIEWILIVLSIDFVFFFFCSDNKFTIF